MGENYSNAQLFSRRCEQLQKSVLRLEETLLVPNVSPRQKLDYNHLKFHGGRVQRLRKEAERKKRQTGQAAEGAQAFLERLRPQYAERLEQKRREEAKKTAVALLREQQRKQEAEQLLEKRRIEAEARAAEEAARAEAEKMAALERAAAESRKQQECREKEKEQAKELRLQSFYEKLDVFAQSLERMQAQPEK